MSPLKVPDEIVELFEMGRAAEECRDVCIGSIFRAKRAIFYARQARRHFREAWDLANKLWPETASGTWIYNYGKREISADEKS